MKKKTLKDFNSATMIIIITTFIMYQALFIYVKSFNPHNYSMSVGTLSFSSPFYR